MSQRTRENLSENRIDERIERFRKAQQTGEYIDQFTTAKDNRTTDEILSRVPKCCIGAPPAPTTEELMIKHKLKPATVRDTSRRMK